MIEASDRVDAAGRRQTKEGSMGAVQAVRHEAQSQTSTELDAIVIGAGVAGI